MRLRLALWSGVVAIAAMVLGLFFLPSSLDIPSSFVCPSGARLIREASPSYFAMRSSLAYMRMALVPMQQHRFLWGFVDALFCLISPC